jgi:AcrR family transcriptional regulator
MGSKDRIQRLKDETRCKILDASLAIVKEEGWAALSMRKIADKIEYTAPIIYEYFSNKDAILTELTRIGYLKLAEQMKEAEQKHTDPAEQLKSMWLAYWNFAFEEKELYQVMYGVEVNCCVMENACPDMQVPSNMLWDKIAEVIPEEMRTDEYIDIKYYTFWSVVHGLISINMTNRLSTDEINRQVLSDALNGIVASMTVTTA